MGTSVLSSGNAPVNVQSHLTSSTIRSKHTWNVDVRRSLGSTRLDRHSHDLICHTTHKVAENSP